MKLNSSPTQCSRKKLEKNSTKKNMSQLGLTYQIRESGHETMISPKNQIEKKCMKLIPDQLNIEG